MKKQLKTVTLYRLEKDGYGPMMHPELGFRDWESPLTEIFEVLAAQNVAAIEQIDAASSWSSLGASYWDEDCDAYSFACTSLDLLFLYWTEEFVGAALSFGFQAVAIEVAVLKSNVKSIHYCDWGIQAQYLKEMVISKRVISTQILGLDAA